MLPGVQPFLYDEGGNLLPVNCGDFWPHPLYLTPTLLTRLGIYMKTAICVPRSPKTLRGMSNAGLKVPSWVYAVDLLWHAGSRELRAYIISGSSAGGGPHRAWRKPCHMDAGGHGRDCHHGAFQGRRTGFLRLLPGGYRIKTYIIGGYCPKTGGLDNSYTEEQGVEIHS
jgi:hypothetical protein